MGYFSLCILQTLTKITQINVTIWRGSTQKQSERATTSHQVRTVGSKQSSKHQPIFEIKVEIHNPACQWATTIWEQLQPKSFSSKFQFQHRKTSPNDVTWKCKHWSKMGLFSFLNTRVMLVSNLFSTEPPLNFGSKRWSMIVAAAPCMNKCYWAECVGWTGGLHPCQGYCSRGSLTRETTPAPGYVQRKRQRWYWKSLKVREGREFDFSPCKFAVGHQSSIVCWVTRSQHSCSPNHFLPHLTVERQEMCKCVVEKIS